MKFVVIPLLAFLFYSCGSISFLSKKEVYSEDFLGKFKVCKDSFLKNQREHAILCALQIDDRLITPSEQALKYNFIGVVKFVSAQYADAIGFFEKSMPNSSDDPALEAQIALNAASCYFKLENYERSFDYLKSINEANLADRDKKKFFQLGHIIAAQMGEHDFALRSLINYLAEVKDIKKLKENPLYSRLFLYYSHLSAHERLRLIGDFSGKSSIVVGVLAHQELEESFYRGELHTVESLISWMKEEFSGNSLIESWIADYDKRLHSSSRVTTKSIGVVLPLSGEKKDFGLRALAGIEFALKKRYKDSEPPRLLIRDDMGVAQVGAERIRELVEQESVGIVIGGLFPKEATEQFLETRKYGAMFLSLSPVDLGREEKNHLIIELQGSVESQVASLFSSTFLDQYGKRGAIIFQNDEKGKNYVNEFWGQAEQKQVQIKGVQAFTGELEDYRKTVREILGLEFVYERKEERELMKDINNLRFSSYMRRSQELPPEVDFDWVYIPVYPREAMQIVPSFRYYDAFGVTYVGGPSWRNKTMMKEISTVGNVLFVGDDISVDADLNRSYVQEYAKPMKLIELAAYDAVNVAAQLIGSKDFDSRYEFSKSILGQTHLQAASGGFVKEDDKLWIKQMSILKLKKKGVQKI